LLDCRSETEPSGMGFLGRCGGAVRPLRGRRGCSGVNRSRSMRLLWQAGSALPTGCGAGSCPVVSDGAGVARGCQLVKERVGVVRQPVSAPGDVLVGTHQRVLAAIELAGFGLGKVRERERDAALAGGREEPAGVVAAAAQA